MFINRTSINVIFLVPTGLGASIGGHAGDATPAARLIAAACDTLIVHPNVVNASDINEMPSNAMYVMGTTIDDLLAGYIGLAPVRSNRIAVVVNKPVANDTVNIISAARATLGIDAFVVELPQKLRMMASFDDDGQASGTIEGAYEAVEYLETLKEDFGAVAILTDIEVPRDVAENYVRNAGVNPWGGVEAKLTRILTDALKVPCAHGPFGHTLESFNEVIDPRMAAEFVSETYAFCLLKGLHKAPEITDGSKGLRVEDIDALITPINCYGFPHKECVRRGIPIIAVKENNVEVKNPEAYSYIQAESYLEAAGILLAMREGITLESVRRPLAPTLIIGG